MLQLGLIFLFSVNCAILVALLLHHRSNSRLFCQITVCVICCYRKNFNLFLVILVWVLTIRAEGQSLPENSLLCFISDCQEPLKMERILLQTFPKVAAQERLFREIEQCRPGHLFLLGDLIGNASNKKGWRGIDTFLDSMRSFGTKVSATPGNHEYLIRPKPGISNFQKRFPDKALTGFCVRIDSMAIVIINSNFSKLSKSGSLLQEKWYSTTMDSLDSDSSVKIVILGTHHSPYTNSKVVSPSEAVAEKVINRFLRSPKSRLFLSGHSHHLEYFDLGGNKRCMVIGGGGGIDQKLYSGAEEKFKDLIVQAIKPRYFFILIQRNAEKLKITIRGYTSALMPKPEITISL